jgi:predicted dehydrogenase
LLFRSHRSTLPDDEISGFQVETDLVTALSHGPDAVVVSNPTALHLDVAIPAAEAGCHLLMEKPISHSLEGLPDLKSALADGGGRVLVGFQFRFHLGLQKVRELIDENALGRLLSVRVHWGEYLPGWHPWEDYRQGYSARKDLGGGVVLTLSHPLDYMRWLFGEVDALWAFTGQESDLALEVEDTAEIGLRFATGVIGSLHLDYNQRPPSHRMEIIGTNGILRWDNADGVASVYLAGREGWQHYPPLDGFERNDLFLAEMRHFLSVARGNSEPLCTLEDGEWALKLALAVHQSSQEERLIKWN